MKVWYARDADKATGNPTGESVTGSNLAFHTCPAFLTFRCPEVQGTVMPHHQPACELDFWALSRVTKRKRFNSEESGHLINAVFEFEI